WFGRGPRAGARGPCALRLLHQRRHILARLADDRHRRAELDRVAFLDEQLQQHAVVLDVEVHIRLVGLDFGDQVSRRHLVAFLLRPADEHALFHRGRQLRQADDLSHGYSKYRTRLTAATTSLTCGWTSSSRFFAYGMGTSSLVTRSIGASSESMHNRCTW